MGRGMACAKRGGEVGTKGMKGRVVRGGTRIRADALEAEIEEKEERGEAPGSPTIDR